jgi:hypothetical protein
MREIKSWFADMLNSRLSGPGPPVTGRRTREKAATEFLAIESVRLCVVLGPYAKMCSSLSARQRDTPARRLSTVSSR